MTNRPTTPRPRAARSRAPETTTGRRAKLTQASAVRYSAKGAIATHVRKGSIIGVPATGDNLQLAGPWATRPASLNLRDRTSAGQLPAAGGEGSPVSPLG